MPILEMRGISKHFGSLIANDGIDLDVESGEIHALLGENGAGKSTLMKILYGLYQPDTGTITIDGKAVRFKSPADAIAHGIGFVSQHFALVPTFSVAENVVLGYERGARLNHDEIERTVRQTAEQHHFQIDAKALVGDLSVGQQQRVEILKALYRGCRILILDEPTAVLTPRDTAGLFDILRGLQKEGLSVIIITHKLDEVLAISQQVTVLRSGKVVGRVKTNETNAPQLARMMVGRETVQAVRNTDHRPLPNVTLEVDNLTLDNKRGVRVLNNVRLHVQAGEIVGIAGVAGNGQSELVSILTGTAVPRSGSVCVKGKPVAFGDPRECIRHRIARIPEDRLKGVIGDLSVADNLMLEQAEQFTAMGHLQHQKIVQHAKRLIEEYQIKASPHDRVRTLSGGNIQKVILARTLSPNPDLVIAAQPTRGLDVGATEYVHQKLVEQKQRGTAILLLSEDLDEILILSDRILVMYKGEIVGEFTADAVDIDQISLLMTGAANQESKDVSN
ncbi:MAG TPA: ABC transporter ATP-binding protein [Oceanobacillus sp.]|nr:ABC transporter ATP-binding protein [Oceanobacillus sp.]